MSHAHTAHNPAYSFAWEHSQLPLLCTKQLGQRVSEPQSRSSRYRGDSQRLLTLYTFCLGGRHSSYRGVTSPTWQAVETDLADTKCLRHVRS